MDKEQDQAAYSLIIKEELDEYGETVGQEDIDHQIEELGDC